MCVLMLWWREWWHVPPHFEILEMDQIIKLAPRFQERIQPHWDRTLFSLITTSRHLKVILKRIKPIISKSFQIYNCKLMKLHKFGKKHIGKKMVGDVLRWSWWWGFRGTVCVLHFVQAFLWMFNPVGLQSQIIKSSILANRSRNPNHFF